MGFKSLIDRMTCNKKTTESNKIPTEINRT